MVTRIRCARQRSTTTLLAPNRHVPSSTLKKESTRLPPGPTGPRVSPGTQERGGRVATTPFRKGWCHPEAAPRRCQSSRQGFLPKIPVHNPTDLKHRSPRERGLATTRHTTRQHAPPRTLSHHRRLTEASIVGTTGQRRKVDSTGDSSTAAARERTITTVKDGSRPDMAAGHTSPY